MLYVPQPCPECKKRVSNIFQALARLLYSRCEIAILDNILTALDGTTEARVVANLFGSHGWFKKEGTTVLLIANSSELIEPAFATLFARDAKLLTSSTFGGF